MLTKKYAIHFAAVLVVVCTLSGCPNYPESVNLTGLEIANLPEWTFEFSEGESFSD